MEQKDPIRVRRAGARSAQVPSPQALTREPGRPHWRRLLAGSSPREVLARLVNGDPLGVRARVALRLREHCYLMDADRVYLRAVARCARFSSRYRGQPSLEEWLTERVDEALGDLLGEDLEHARGRASAGRATSGGTPGKQRAGAPPASGAPGAGGAPSGTRSAFDDFARPLGLDPVRMRCACVAFNHTDLPARRAFFELVIEGRSLDDLAGSGPSSATAIARRARRALEVCLAAGGLPGEPPECAAPAPERRS